MSMRTLSTLDIVLIRYINFWMLKLSQRLSRIIKQNWGDFCIFKFKEHVSHFILTLNNYSVIMKYPDKSDR